MPKGEHFKKPNPRIIQVSFKVNSLEFDKLQKLANNHSLSIPDFLRNQIDSDVKPPLPVKVEKVKVEKSKSVLKEKAAVYQEKEPAHKEIKEDIKISVNQMSLF